MLQALIELRSDGVTRATKIPGVHDPLDPEFTILKQRLARRIRSAAGYTMHVVAGCCCYIPVPTLI